MNKAKLLLVCLIWLFLLGMGVLVYRLWFVPREARKAEQQEQAIVDQTSGSSNYKHHVRIGLDGFSGYAVIRSQQMHQQMRAAGIKLETNDDGANYGQRLSDLASGKLHMAVFPIDALLAACAQQGSTPATIVAILDETHGADAIVANRDRFPNVDALNSADTQFVVVQDSPSETLVRFLQDNFDLGQLGSQPMLSVADEKALLSAYKQSGSGDGRVFVTWEPVVSELLRNDQMHVLFDSSKQSGYIVDTLVVSRDFLVKQPELVQATLRAYFASLYEIQHGIGFQQLVTQDAKAAGTNLTNDQAKQLADGIRWRNTQENLAHFGLRSAALPHVEDMIDRIRDMLIRTGGLENDPTGGATNRLFHEKQLAQLQSDGFHPGREDIREDAPLDELSEQDWSELVPVGTVDIPPLVYARGTARLTESSKRKLDDLLEKLENFPKYYLMIRGHAARVGDPDANTELAKQRASAALQYLLSQGAAAARLHAVPGADTGQTTVTFVLGQPPY